MRLYVGFTFSVLIITPFKRVNATYVKIAKITNGLCQ